MYKSNKLGANRIKCPGPTCNSETVPNERAMHTNFHHSANVYFFAMMLPGFNAMVLRMLGSDFLKKARFQTTESSSINAQFRIVCGLVRY